MKYAGITFFLLICLLSSSFGKDILFKKITSNQGLSHNTVYAIVQDEKGLMWFGTREGLNRYDSHDIKSYYIASAKIGGSTNKISSLCSYKSLLYVGTDNGLYIYNSQTDKLEKSKVLSYQGSILFLLQQNGQLYVGTSDGVYKLSDNKSKLINDRKSYDKAMCAISEDRFLLAIGNSLRIIDGAGRVKQTFNETTLSELANINDIFDIYKDYKGNIWIATNKGLFNYRSIDQHFSKLKFSALETPENNTIRSVSGSKDALYIGTEEGLYIYNTITGYSENFQQSFTNNPKKLNDNAIYSTCLAKDGSLWIGTYFGGVNYIPSNSYGFRSIKANNKEKGISGKAVSQMMEDSQKRIWIGTEDGGITVYNPGNETFQYINKQSSPFYLKTNNVHAIHNDGYGNIWVGTFLGGLHQFNTKNNTTTIYTAQKGNPNSLSNNGIYAIYRDSKSKLWIGTQHGLNIYDYPSKKFRLFKPHIMGSLFIYDIIEDKQGNLWFCTRHNGIYKYNPADDGLKNYSANNNNSTLLSNQIISVYKDSKQQLWFGTLDGGVALYDFAKDAFKSYTIRDGLPNNNVYGILEDKNGAIWLTTNRGISKLDPKTHRFTNYDNKYGLPSNQFNFKSYLKSAHNILYFGSIDGLCFFNPTSIAKRYSSLPLIFTDFKLFNKSVVPGDSSILQNQINHTNKIELAYDQNVFTINYVAIDYANPGSTNYAYYLEGFENKWNYVGDKNSVTYTNLSPGNYVFHLKALSPSGLASSSERTIKIYVAPPFYLTKLAYFTYFLLIAALIWLYTRFVKFLHQKKLEIQLERIEKEKIKELTQHRLNFFTFISHEFKTPLTLIIASIDKFLDDKGLEFRKSAELSNVKSNASILFKLIQQLMEFRKIETDHSSIDLAKSDIIDCIQNATYHFETIAIQKGINLKFTCSETLLECYFDKDKMETILFNILSNAIKNTSAGSIEVTVELKDQYDEKAIQIRITDTGKGMSASEIKNIFNPFYKSASNKADTENSGIGLALVDSLVKYLNGNIQVSSELHKGTSIEITLPVMIRLADAKEKKHLTQQKEKAEELKHIEKNNEITLKTNDIEIRAKYTLLIVEDNKELLTFLSEHFAKTYDVTTASNGLQAIKKINKATPDIIISDVRMPKMDGLELCSTLKNDKRFNYIPIILLSDSNTENIKIDGLDVGADAYVSKPFNLKEFELLISNMIRSRVILREHVIGIGSFNTDKLPSNNKDQEFLSKLSEVLESEFSNRNITIEDIARVLNTNRTSLHLNLKRILDKNATELLNEYRLKKALIMLENDMPINEIAHHCGYSDSNYFSRIFKRTYGETPVNYKRKTFNKKVLDDELL